jgi:hypothetical protein
MHLILALPNGNHRCKVWACMDYTLDSSNQFNTLLSTDSTIFREIHWHISLSLTQWNKGEISNPLLNPLDDFVLSSSQKSPWTCAYSAISNLEDVRQENTPRSTQSISVWHGQGWSVNNKPAIFAFSSCTVHNCWLYHTGFRQVNQMYALLSCLSPFHQTKSKSAVDPSAGVQHTKGDTLLNNTLQDEQNLSPCAGLVGLRHSKSCFQAPFKKYSIHQKRVAGIRISFQN